MLKASSSAIKISIAPYDRTQSFYSDLLQQPGCGSSIDWINYQVYSILGTSATTTQYNSAYADVVSAYGGYNKVGEVTLLSHPVWWYTM